jgi:hypothetical protein
MDLARRSARRGVLAEIRRLGVRMAEENPTWGYTRIQGALKNVGHRVGRSTIARILKTQGLPPVPERPTSWQTFLRAHKDAIVSADFFTTEVWTWRGLVTVYTVFVTIWRLVECRFLGPRRTPTRRSCGRSGGRSRWQTPSPAASSFVIGTRNGVDQSASACVRPESGSCRRRIRRRTRMRTPNGLFDQSKKNASTGSFPWASIISGERYVNTSRTTISNGIIKGLGIRSSPAHLRTRRVRFVADRAWADY